MKRGPKEMESGVGKEGVGPKKRVSPHTLSDLAAIMTTLKSTQPGKLSPEEIERMGKKFQQCKLELGGDHALIKEVGKFVDIHMEKGAHELAHKIRLGLLGRPELSDAAVEKLMDSAVLNEIIANAGEAQELDRVVFKHFGEGDRMKVLKLVLEASKHAGGK
jgi:hypothetical protein